MMGINRIFQESILRVVDTLCNGMEHWGNALGFGKAVFTMSKRSFFVFRRRLFVRWMEGGSRADSSRDSYLGALTIQWPGFTHSY